MSDPSQETGFVPAARRDPLDTAFTEPPPLESSALDEATRTGTSRYDLGPLFNKRVMIVWALGAFALWFAVAVIRPVVVEAVKDAVMDNIKQPGSAASRGGITVTRNPDGSVTVTRRGETIVTTPPEPGYAVPTPPTPPAPEKITAGASATPTTVGGSGSAATIQPAKPKQPAGKKIPPG